MKNRIRIIILVGVFLFSVLNVSASGTISIMGNAGLWYSTVASYRGSGYSCEASETCILFCYAYCTLNTSYVSSYGATQLSYQTLEGYANYLSSFDEVYINHSNTPFLYLQNPPEGDISVNIDSERDKYYPKPDFNQENGWLVESKDDKISVDGEEKDNLFYELETSKITLNRNGKNFSSKDEIIDYLENSDFLTNIGFSEVEKKNSLGYFIPKLKESKDNNYYYLTILSDKAIAEISDLNINPKPENIVRQYFAVYPTPVPVKTAGDFKFTQSKETTEFTAKETGEFLIQKPMQVFFE